MIVPAIVPTIVPPIVILEEVNPDGGFVLIDGLSLAVLKVISFPYAVPSKLVA